VLVLPANRVTTILAGERAISADTALRLARHSGTSAEFWLRLRMQYDLERAPRPARERIERESSPRAA
jgi:addiction module HigA family antidote